MIKFAKKLDALLGIVFHIFEWIVRLLLVAIILVVSAQVFTRNLLSYNIRWADEAAIDLFVYIVFFSLAIAVRYDIHLRVELFVSRIPKRGRIAIEFLNNLFLLFLSILMIYSGYKLALQGLGSIQPTTRLPNAVIYAATPIAGIVCFLHILLRIFNIAKSDTATRYIEGVFDE